MKVWGALAVVACLATGCLDFGQFQVGTSSGSGGEGGQGGSGGQGGGDPDGQGGADPTPTVLCGPEEGEIRVGLETVEWGTRGSGSSVSGSTISSTNGRGGLYTKDSYPFGNCYLAVGVASRPVAGKAFVALTASDSKTEFGLGEVSLVLGPEGATGTLDGVAKPLEGDTSQVDAVRMLFTEHYVEFQVLFESQVVASRRRTRPEFVATANPLHIGVGLDARGTSSKQSVTFGTYGQPAP